MEKEDLKILAQNLANPQGEKGIEIGEMMNATNIGMTLESIKTLLIEDNEHILEIGHGNAAHVKSILNKAKNLKYTGIDISETMHKEAQRFNEDIKNQAEFILYEGKILPFEEKTFDKIFTVNTVYFWKEPVKFLNEIYRILKDNGTFVLTFAQRNFMESLPFTKYGFILYSTSEMEEMVSKSHFKRMKVSEKSELVKSKAENETIRRIYTVLTIKK
ncbi:MULTISPECIES: class I SAM-dependent methyltransferase [Chryseobacterium]|uniref:Ubiquinone/menaquinone biosynthesis C-methylase UbiE n=1 Tax=Chryseobacterium geocarposphaerae TaxID=1416776 RepID=A0ABU1L9N8_9FLAO|nr:MULTISPECIES: class I SAM-dependent methyltransferase [Chryseobacterium]ALR29869.1 methyltransferase type 11 [Chryseobacterium sp. IHB B 17019]MDR6403441.1 ubiquinone/menaquinone biosynthesis C-methylase UbiE [Chryseobacterium geocarposphaerae]MDR6696995.1 ubiquinone/menaquinone biosynthesis C-methylase UbiE [Chryseobacterium ginsenosidimutans]